MRVVEPNVKRDSLEYVLEPNWTPCAVLDGARPEQFCFACLTTRVPRAEPMSQPCGIADCTGAELRDWQSHQWDQAPYHYARQNKVASDRLPASSRRLIANECERAHGLPTDYTVGLRQMTTRSGTQAYVERRRQTLLGNSWHLHVVMFLLAALLRPLNAH